MRIQHRWWSGLVAAMLGGLVGVTAVAAGEQFLPVLSTREGALRAVLAPFANGFIDYVTLLNKRDGGIHGVPLGLGRVRNRLGRSPRHRMLRAPESQGAHGASGDAGVRYSAHAKTPSLSCG